MKIEYTGFNIKNMRRPPKQIAQVYDLFFPQKKGTVVEADDTVEHDQRAQDFGGLLEREIHFCSEHGLKLVTIVEGIDTAQGFDPFGRETKREFHVAIEEYNRHELDFSYLIGLDSSSEKIAGWKSYGNMQLIQGNWFEPQIQAQIQQRIKQLMSASARPIRVLLLWNNYGNQKELKYLPVIISTIKPETLYVLGSCIYKFKKDVINSVKAPAAKLGYAVTGHWSYGGAQIPKSNQKEYIQAQRVYYPSKNRWRLGQVQRSPIVMIECKRKED
jgi:hypothetical protein